MLRNTGTYEGVTLLGSQVQAFVPHPLPPIQPRLDLSLLMPAAQSASHAVAKLDALASTTPSADWMAYGTIRKEALLTSVIEGANATMADLILAEAGCAVPNQDDVEEVTNYLAAYAYAHAQAVNPDGLAIGMRLLNNAHQILMSGARGRSKTPGVVRRNQNWVGGSTPATASLVPPPPQRLGQCLAELEKYITYSTGDLQPHEEAAFGHLCDPEVPALIRIGLIHAQFETIHPYLDGNGRVGRLLIAILLESWGLLSKPLLPISTYLKQHQSDYYARLSAIRTEGDWEGWLLFFLSAVEGAATQAHQGITDIGALIACDRMLVLDHPERTTATLSLFDHLATNPCVTVESVAEHLGATPSAALKAIATLVACGVLHQWEGVDQPRIFPYRRYLDLLAR